jgi:hypothetical protein
MAQLFVDTWGWLTLRDKGERRHAVVAPVFREGCNAFSVGSILTHFPA